MQHVLSAGALAALALTLSMTAAPSARAATVETFDGATPSNSAYFNAPIPGTGLEVVDGYAWVAQADADHGHILDLASGWYSTNFDSQANVGSTTVRSTQAFDLLAGTTYTLQFDYSRQTFSAGNGPFDTSLTAALGDHSVRFTDVAGFYYGFDWQTGTLSFTQQVTQLGAHVSFTASGPAGYSGMDIDNISMVGVAPAAPSPVPEPAGAALALGGLGLLALRARRLRRG